MSRYYLEKGSLMVTLTQAQAHIERVGGCLSTLKGKRADRARDILRLLYVLTPHMGKLDPKVRCSMERLYHHAHDLATQVGVEVAPAPDPTS